MLSLRDSSSTKLALLRATMSLGFHDSAALDQRACSALDFFSGTARADASANMMSLSDISSIRLAQPRATLSLGFYDSEALERRARSALDDFSGTALCDASANISSSPDSSSSGLALLRAAGS